MRIAAPWWCWCSFLHRPGSEYTNWEVLKGCLLQSLLDVMDLMYIYIYVCLLRIMIITIVKTTIIIIIKTIVTYVYIYVYYYIYMYKYRYIYICMCFFFNIFPPQKRRYSTYIDCHITTFLSMFAGEIPSNDGSWMDLELP